LNLSANIARLTKWLQIAVSVLDKHCVPRLEGNSSLRMVHDTVNAVIVTKVYHLISKFRRVVNVVFFLLGNSPASEFYVPTFRNTLFHPLTSRAFFILGDSRRLHFMYRRFGTLSVLFSYVLCILSSG
jgi:hypothetical protein